MGSLVGSCRLAGIPKLEWLGMNSGILSAIINFCGKSKFWILTKKFASIET